MTRGRIPLVLKTAVFAAALIVLLAAVGLYFFQTAAFQEAIRHRVISALEKSTGGRVELGSVDYRWTSFSAELHNLVIHGTEPANSPALFSASAVNLRLKLSLV